MLIPRGFELTIPVSRLFNSQDEAHAEMMAVYSECMRELQDAGQPLPSLAEMTRQISAIWSVWREFG